MGSSDKGTCVVDCSVGTIVWVRRWNGSWWPGKILGPEELSAAHLMSPRSGTPIKLLGREDASGFKICPSLEEQLLEFISIIFQLHYDYKVTRKQLLQALAQSDIILSKLGATRENVNDTASIAQISQVMDASREYLYK